MRGGKEEEEMRRRGAGRSTQVSLDPQGGLSIHSSALWDVESLKE